MIQDRNYNLKIKLTIYFKCFIANRYIIKITVTMNTIISNSNLKY